MQGIKIYDVLGKLIKVEDMAEFVDKKQISLTGITPGVYFLKIDTGDRQLVRKVVVIH